MAFQPVPNTVVAEIITAFGLSGSIQNNLYFRFSGGYTQSDLDDLANDVANFWANGAMPTLSAGTTLIAVHVRGLESELDLEAFANTDVPTVGSNVSAALPSNVALALKFTTGFIGRSARGRIYIGGWGESSVTGNLVVTSHADFIRDAFINDLVTTIPAGCEHVVVSRYHNGVLRVSGQVLPVTGYSYTDYRVDSQRRRLKNIT